MAMMMILATRMMMMTRGKKQVNIIHANEHAK